MKVLLTEWIGSWAGVFLLGLQLLLIIVVGYILQRLLARGLTRVANHYHLPAELILPIRGGLRWLIMGSALLLSLERLGVSAGVLWTALSGFMAIVAIAFFAVWSVLSNLFCAVMIFTIGPVRLGDKVEVMDTFEKPGAKGRVVAINMLYTTLEEDGTGGTVLLQVPNNLLFQRIVRRWRSAEHPLLIIQDET